MNADGDAVRIESPGSLAAVSTFRLGGKAPEIFHCSEPEALVDSVRKVREGGRPFVLLGGGSNLLISDEGVTCPVIRFAAEEAVVVPVGANLFAVSAAASLDDFVLEACRAGLSGMECCSGIPGTVGGAVAGNAGAWGKQISDVLERVDVLGDSGELVPLHVSQLGMRYRDSSLKHGGGIVLRAVFRLQRAEAASLLAERERILVERARRHPDLSRDPCIGSFFRNIEPTSAAGKRQAAGWYLEQAGALSMEVGGARVFPRHANIIVKGDGCTAQNVYDLSLRMQEAVLQKFGLQLVREIRLLGRFDGVDEPAPNSFY